MAVIAAGLSFSGLMFGSCKGKETIAGGKKAVARVGKTYLYESDVKEFVPAGTPAADSAKLVKEFVDRWIREQVMVQKAEQYLSDEQMNFEKKMQDYRNSLVTHLYEQELVRENLDTVVNDAEIEAYYNNNKSNFELKDNIVKVRYLKLAKKSPKLDKVKVWYKSENEKDRKQLEEYGHQYALNYYLDDNTWLLFDDLIKEIPIKTYDKEQFLRNNRFIEIEDSSSVYLVNIKGFMIKDSMSPLSFERQNIMNQIINKRKLKLIQEMEKKAYEEAMRNNTFEIY